MLVVSDTSPLNYLILIKSVDVLPSLYGRVAAPRMVLRELLDPEAPPPVRDWAARPPSWLEVIGTPEDSALYPELDRGEAEAIWLAKSLSADLLLIDERKATRIARDQEHLRTTGILGVLLDAASVGLIDLASALTSLRTSTTFHAPNALFDQLLRNFANPKGPA